MKISITLTQKEVNLVTNALDACIDAEECSPEVKATFMVTSPTWALSEPLLVDVLRCLNLYGSMLIDSAEEHAVDPEAHDIYLDGVAMKILARDIKTVCLTITSRS